MVMMATLALLELIMGISAIFNHTLSRRSNSYSTSCNIRFSSTINQIISRCLKGVDVEGGRLHIMHAVNVNLRTAEVIIILLLRVLIVATA